MGFFNSPPPEPQPVNRAGKDLTCAHCGHAAFHAGEAQLNTQGLTFLGLDWLNGNADYFACARCGHVHWFLQVMP
ncbi:hypothetical protein F8S09_09290 [Deinococcus sp. SDU3-2]|uniref:DNA-binding protein n=1 Tax=Deinococcus terrestris TaxID=2651870 RepID=A0A7X1TRY5_9DEIO|nr:hypothetical protein [Deinococcus terrestris]MPY66881.1 hypothetical protein [Deinococcus terrestris]